MEERIKSWLQQGLIDEETSQKLLEDVKRENIENAKLRFNIFIYTVAAICLAIGVELFISANEWIVNLFKKRPIVRIISVFGLSIGSLISGYILAFKKNNFPRLGKSLIFLSSLLFGVSLFLIWYSYKIKNYYEVMMFAWLALIFPIAYKFKNNSVHGLSIFVFTIGMICLFLDNKVTSWSIYEQIFICPIISGCFLYTIAQFMGLYEKDYKVVGLSLIFCSLLVMVSSSLKVDSVSIFSWSVLLSLLFANLCLYFKKSKRFNKIESLLLIGLISTVTGLSLFSTEILICTSHALIIAILLGGFKYGYKANLQSLIRLLNCYTVLYIGFCYFHWAWNRLSKSIFFIIGGIILFSLGIFLERKRKKT